MKTMAINLAAVTILLMAGVIGLSAQNFRGNQYLRNQRGGCLNSNLTSEQQAELVKLSTAHQAEMDALRTELRSNNDPAQLIRIRAKMDKLQADHRLRVVELGAIPANTPHAGFYYRRGRAAYGGWGRAAYGGQGQAAYGGRGLGPCGAGLGPRR